jgi:hypothetical protein
MGIPKRQIQGIRLERSNKKKVTITLPENFSCYKLAVKSLIAEISTYLSDKFGVETAPDNIDITGGFDYLTKDFKLGFKYKPSGYNGYPHCFVITRIFFTDTRTGHGTCLMRFLCSLSYKYKILFYSFESAASIDSQMFAKKLGFKVVEAVDGNLIVDVTTLKNNLI